MGGDDEVRLRVAQLVADGLTNREIGDAFSCLRIR